jgi:hypothetical protein
MDFFAEIREPYDFNAALRARAQQLDVSRATIDAIAHLQEGYSAKLLSPHPKKHLGQISFRTIRSLGLRVFIIDDLDATEALKDQLEPRRKQQRFCETTAAVNLAPRLVHFILGERARRLNRSRTPAQRTESARRAANARWQNRARQLSR